jgi:hypothetical protein
MYSLISDGKLVDTKTMLFTEKKRYFYIYLSAKNKNDFADNLLQKL